MRAIQDKLIVKRSEAESQSGRFLLAGQKQPDKGTVIAVGPGKLTKTGKRIPVPVKVGESVYFDKETGQPLEEGGEHYVVLLPDQIIGIEEANDACISYGGTE